MNKYHEKEESEEKGPEKDWQADVCRLVLDEWEKGRQYVSSMNDMYDDLYLMLRGERPERTYDWQSNLSINKMFQVIWAAVPYLIQKIFGASPIMGIKSFDKKGAWQREAILEYWHTLQPGNSSRHNPYFAVMVMWILRGLLNGTSYMKKTWHQKLDVRETTQKYFVPVKKEAPPSEEPGSNPPSPVPGASVPTEAPQAPSIQPARPTGQTQPIEMEQHERTQRVEIPLEDWPYNEVVNNKDIVVDWLLQPGQSCRQGRFVIHRSITDLDSLKKSDIDYMNLDEISPINTVSNKTIQQDHSTVTNKDDQSSTPVSDIYAEIEVYERVGLFPVYKKKKKKEWVACVEQDEMYDKDVEYKFMVIAVARDVSRKEGKGVEQKDVLIRFEPSPYEEINYIDMHVFFDPERHQSTGMAEPIKDIQTALNDNINAAFDEIYANLMPPVIVDKLGLWDWDTMQYAPHQRWLKQGPIEGSIMWKPPTDITRDAWIKHDLFDKEIQLTTVTNAMAGMGKEKAATTNVLNAQLSAGKLDFIVRMIETTALIPSAQMDIRFAKKFAHKLTFGLILGQPLKMSAWEEIYKYQPVASSVKTDQQREIEIQQNIQMIQTIAPIQNPGVPKLINLFLQDILRQRNMPDEADMLDENYYEPTSDAGNIQMLNKMAQKPALPPGKVSNQNRVQMTGKERSARQNTFTPRGLLNAVSRQ